MNVTQDTSSGQQTAILNEQIVLMLVGLIGSGKSTFAQALEEHFSQAFKRCNQDDLGGDRRRVESLARDSLRQGLSVCIDRTNFDARQRSHWINIARQFHQAPVWVIVFDTPYEVCKARLEQRTSHPTIKSPEEAVTLLQRFANEFVHPTSDEGYHRLIWLKPSDHPSPTYTPEELIAILDRVRTSPILTRHLSPSVHQFRGRGRGYYPHARNEQGSPSSIGSHRNGDTRRLTQQCAEGSDIADIRNNYARGPAGSR